MQRKVMQHMKTMSRFHLWFEAFGTAMLCICAGLLVTAPALAAAPMVKTPAPGYFRFMLGDFEITALSDGTAEMPVDKLLHGIKPAQLRQALANSYLETPLESSFNGFLINTGAKLILIDTGAGKLFGPTLGGLARNLEASGYQPAQVDEIYITHMHPDHVGGLLAGDQRAFPNAILRADQKEADYWLSAANLARAPADSKGFFEGAQAAVNPYLKAGRFKPFAGGGELTPGIVALATPGHTPGHTSYVVASQGHRLIVIGDLIHVGAVQFAEPTVTIAFDSDAKSALAERLQVFNAAAKDGDLIAGAHLAFPGIGHLRTLPRGYAWIPLNYTVIR